MTVNPAPLPNAGADAGYCSGDSALIGTTTNADYTYSWSPTIGLSSATVSNPTVTLTNTSAVPLITPYIVIPSIFIK